MTITISGTSGVTTPAVVFSGDSTTQTSAAVTTPNVQTFNSSGTWTKPSGGFSMCLIQLWGGGGGAGRVSSNSGYYTNNAGSGGGGAYNEIVVPLSYLASSVSITVGSGGAGATTAAYGASGGDSSVPFATAYNGKTSISANGGSGGSGGSGGFQLVCGTGGFPSGIGLPNEGMGFAYTDIYGGNNGGPYNGFYGGGGGGGGSSVFGGGGGGGGTSGRAGNGGLTQATPTSGAQPGGGGGASTSLNVTGGSGGAGQVVITCW